MTEQEIREMIDEVRQKWSDDRFNGKVEMTQNEAIAKAHKQALIDARIEELTRFAQSNPRLQNTFETIVERIAELKKGLQGEWRTEAGQYGPKEVFYPKGDKE